MTMEANCKWCGRLIEMKTSYIEYEGESRYYVHTMTGNALCTSLVATPAEPSSPESSGDEVISELSYDLDAAHRLYCDVKNTDSNPEYARCLARLGELLRIEAAYKRGGGK